MKKETSEESRIARVVTLFAILSLLVVGFWAYVMYQSYDSLQQFSKIREERYQTENVEMALATDFVKSKVSTSTTFSHASRNGHTFYFQGDDGNGHFMFIIRQVKPGEFEVVNGITSLQISQPE